MAASKTGIAWRVVPSWPAYEVSERGDVRRVRTGRILRGQANESGHRFFTPARSRKCFIHRAVLEAFVGPCPVGQEALHRDDNPANNALANLHWGTRRENVADKRRNGRIPIGERSGTAVLTEAVVLRLRAGEPGTLRALGRRYVVSHTTILAAKNGTKWTHLPGGTSGS
jgi:hypothetical protein